MSSRTEWFRLFEEHLDFAANSKKPLASRQLHATLAQIYYKLWEKAV